jgi:hypothetical protein
MNNETIVVTPKHWYHSKVIWFNVVATLGELADLIHGIEGFIPSSWLPWVAMMQGVGNIILRRFFTNQPLK